MRQGERRGTEVDLLDFTYDGKIKDRFLSGGLGMSKLFFININFMSNQDWWNFRHNGHVTNASDIMYLSFFLDDSKMFSLMFHIRGYSRLSFWSLDNLTSKPDRSFPIFEDRLQPLLISPALTLETSGLFRSINRWSRGKHKFPPGQWRYGNQRLRVGGMEERHLQQQTHWNPLQIQPSSQLLRSSHPCKQYVYEGSESV